MTYFHPAAKHRASSQVFSTHNAPARCQRAASSPYTHACMYIMRIYIGEACTGRNSQPNQPAARPALRAHSQGLTSPQRPSGRAPPGGSGSGRWPPASPSLPPARGGSGHGWDPRYPGALLLSPRLCQGVPMQPLPATMAARPRACARRGGGCRGNGGGGAVRGRGQPRRKPPRFAPALACYEGRWRVSGISSAGRGRKDPSEGIRGVRSDELLLQLAQLSQRHAGKPRVQRPRTATLATLGIEGTAVWCQAPGGPW